MPAFSACSFSLPAVAASREDSNSIGINGNQRSDPIVDDDSGAVYMFSRSGNNWSQQAYIKSGNSEAGDRFGRAISLANNGKTLAVGASKEDSNATGLNGDAGDSSAESSGAVYLY
ncbi:MAG: FG-GAP repeat protein [Gammaproteobacteria bacterium]|nr:FG-GAP repeat protein [Gammaproteobacteria bacterium]